MSSPATTLHDVAKAAKVSIAAVSLALRGEGSISDSTRARIVEVAQKLNYRRNVYAASLRKRDPEASGHGMPLAVLIQHTRDGHYPIESVLVGLRDECFRLGFDLQEHHIERDQPLRPLLRMLFHRGIQGLFISHSLDSEKSTPEDWERFSVVACNRGQTAPIFHTVRAGSFDIIIHAMQILHQRGYRRIGGALFRHSPPVLDDTAREAAFAWAQKKWKFDKLSPFLGNHVDKKGFMDWLQKTKPDAVLAFHIGCWFWMKEAVGAASKKTGFCCLHLEKQMLDQGIAGYFTPDIEIGRASVLLMDSLIRHHERGIPCEVREILLQRTLQDGTTLPKTRNRVVKKVRGLSC